MNMKHKIVQMFFLLFSQTISHSMEHELVPFLDKNKLQSDTMVLENKQALVCHLSSKLFLLQQSISVPREIWGEIYTKMVDVMFEGDEEFENSFYSKPTAEALELYHAITKKVGRDKPIAPLFKMEQKDRDEFFNLLGEVNTWYGDYVDPVISIEKQQKIYNLDPILQRYFSAKNVRVLSYAEMDRYNKGQGTVLGGNFVHVANGISWSVLCCLGGVEAACSSGILASAGAICGIGCLVNSVGLGCLVPVYCDQSNKVTL